MTQFFDVDGNPRQFDTWYPWPAIVRRSAHGCYSLLPVSTDDKLSALIVLKDKDNNEWPCVPFGGRPSRDATHWMIRNPDFQI